MGYRFQSAGPGLQSQTLVDAIPGVIKAFNGGEIRSYYDVVSRSK